MNTARRAGARSRRSLAQCLRGNILTGKDEKLLKSEAAAGCA
jgi:hypothetical protein